MLIRVGFDLSVIADFRQWLLIGAANAFVGRLRPLDDRHQRCQVKSISEIRGKKKCLVYLVILSK